MNQSKHITIIGGGLAGLSLGIGLRQRGVPVKIYEAGKYPRHRVCGEFISGRGQRSLERLGLRDQLIQTGTRVAQTAAFFSGKTSFKKDLPEPALCVSRFILDNLLAEEFCKLGGELKSGSRWVEKFDEGMVRATGRRIQNVVKGWRLFGLKIHAKNLPLEADLEMHFTQNGYVGLCRLERGSVSRSSVEVESCSAHKNAAAHRAALRSSVDNSEVNICGLFRSRTTLRDLSSHWLKNEISASVGTRLAQAEFDENSFCSVAGLSLAPQKASEQNECSIGDSLTMIPPVTGNGMSMAFESAELAIEPLAQYSAGKISWTEAHKLVASSCDQIFTQRLVWSKYLQTALFQPFLRQAVLLLTPRLPGLWSAFFSHTR